MPLSSVIVRTYQKDNTPHCHHLPVYYVLTKRTTHPIAIIFRYITSVPTRTSLAFISTSNEWQRFPVIVAPFNKNTNTKPRCNMGKDYSVYASFINISVISWRSVLLVEERKREYSGQITDLSQVVLTNFII